MHRTSFNVSIETLEALPDFTLSSATRYSFSSVVGKEDAIYDVEPAIPVALRSTVGFGLAVWVAAALQHAHRDVTQIDFHFNQPVPAGLLAISEAFTKMTGTGFGVAPIGDAAGADVNGDVFLVSGGKDTLFAIEREAGKGSLSGRPAVYLARGAELAWRKELSIVDHLCRRFGLKLNLFHLFGMGETGDYALKFGPRAAWRELVTIALARQYGDRIVTGINDDAIFRSSPELNGPIIFLSQLEVSVLALERALDASIVTVPGEFEVYQATRNNEFFDATGSCLKPDSCVENALCNKCRVFNIYDAVINGTPLTPQQQCFVTSPNYIGDAAIARALRLGELKCS